MKKTIHIHLGTADTGRFEESKHPRADDGRFGNKAGEHDHHESRAEKNGSHAATQKKQAAPGSQLPEVMKKKLRDHGMVGTFPPADVPVSAIKHADLSADAESLKYQALMSWVQKTKSGRLSRQYRYTKEFHERNAAEKFSRVSLIEPHIEKIQRHLTTQMADGTLTPREREAAAIASAIRETGLRPTDGSESVKHGHYGISSLQARHAKVVGKEINLDFIGKEGIRNQTIIKEPVNVAYFKEALKGKSGDQPVFAIANSDDAGAALKAASLKVGGPSDIKIKDLRTLKATQTAESVVDNYDGVPPPLTGIEAKDTKLIQSAILKMSAQVSTVLNNTPEQARANYINPRIWKSWQSKLASSLQKKN